MTNRLALACATTLAAAATAAPAQTTPVLRAQYDFNGTLASSVAGARPLTAIDPTGGNGFANTIDGGTPRTVYQTRGATAPAQQGGLRFDSTGLYGGAGYSASLTFRSLPTTSNWVRLFDTIDGLGDDGLYLSPSRLVTLFGGTNPVADTNATVNTGSFYNLTYTVSAAANPLIRAYLNGVEVASANGSLLNLPTSGIVTLFRDNYAGGVTTEWAPADVDSFSFYDGVLSGAQIRELNGVGLPPGSAVPEPASWALMICGFGLVGGALRRARPMARPRLV